MGRWAKTDLGWHCSISPTWEVNQMKITFIGGGNMGEAMLSALVSKQVASAKDITVSEPIEERRQFLTQKYSIKTTPSNPGAIAGADVVVLAVKPQVLPSVLTDLAGLVKGSQFAFNHRWRPH